MLARLSTLALVASFLIAPYLVTGLSSSDIPADTPITQLLSTAQGFLSQGKMSDALVYYDIAVARDPTDYLTFFKRATTYLSLGRIVQASEDFSQVLKLRPGLEGAHLQLAKIKTQIADWESAKEHYKKAGKALADAEYSDFLEATVAADQAFAAEQAANWEECVSQADLALVQAHRALSLRELRARCCLETGQISKALVDLHYILQLRPGDITPYLTISATNFYALGELDAGIAQARKCLHSDPESKLCKKLLKDEKTIDKALQKVTKALDRNQPITAARQLVMTEEDEGLIAEVEKQAQTLRNEGIIPKTAGHALLARLVEMACQSYYESNSKKARDMCERSIGLDADSFYGMLYKAKSQLEADEFEQSINTLNRANEIRPEKKDIVNPLLEKAQVALRRSKTKDYYKVLGVAHDADERQIKSAYRRLSKQHHPDKAAKQGISKEAAEKKMASINEAYEVLSNPELRARFDRGDDPNSQEQQNSNPFSGGSPFGFQQGAQQFHFKFASGGFPF